MTHMIHEAAFKSILFPVDFSQISEITAPHVRALAQLTGASVTLLHVVPWLAAWYGSSEMLPQISGDQLLINLKRQTEAALAIFQKKHFDSSSSVRLIKEGAVAETITEVAAELGVDLIMMPTRGQGRSRPFLIGSTTAKVLHDASSAVWTSPHLATLKPFAGLREILCAIDRDNIPPGFVEEVARLAISFQSNLSFVTAVSGAAHAHQQNQRSIRALHEEFPQAHMQELVFPSYCRIFEEAGSIGEVVRKTVEMQNIDLVLASRGHLKNPFGKFRTHLYEIVLDSPCPVLSLCFSSGSKHDGTAASRAFMEV